LVTTPDSVAFASAAKFRAWLERNHQRATELWIRFDRATAKTGTLTYKQAVDEALCFGWIDGVIGKSVDDASYTRRFTPRKAKSIWSAVNIRRAAELEALGKMTEAGRAALSAREEKRSRVYSFEQENVAFDEAQSKAFRKNKRAWRFFESLPASYRRAATWWVISAKRVETRAKRLAELIELSSRDERLPHLSKWTKKR
jgi:uncharacterized protein YdeI (YjbR/CyaY-like superfamily)